MARKTKEDQNPADEYFLVDIENGSVQHFYSLDAVRSELEQNDDLKEKISNCEDWSDQLILFKGRRIDFTAELKGVSVSFPGEEG